MKAPWWFRAESMRVVGASKDSPGELRITGRIRWYAWPYFALRAASRLRFRFR